MTEEISILSERIKAQRYEIDRLRWWLHVCAAVILFFIGWGFISVVQAVGLIVP